MRRTWFKYSKQPKCFLLIIWSVPAPGPFHAPPHSICKVGARRSQDREQPPAAGASGAGRRGAAARRRTTAPAATFACQLGQRLLPRALRNLRAVGHPPRGVLHQAVEEGGKLLLGQHPARRWLEQQGELSKAGCWVGLRGTGQAARAMAARPAACLASSTKSPTHPPTHPSTPNHITTALTCGWAGRPAAPAPLPSACAEPGPGA